MYSVRRFLQKNVDFAPRRRYNGGMRYLRKKFAAFPVYEWLEIGLMLCLAGGFLDAYTFVTRGGVFANAQTGNMILLAIGLAGGDGLRALRYLVPILFFFAGVFLSELLLRLGKKTRGDFRGHGFVLAAEIAVLVVVGFLPADVPDMLVNALVSFAAAVQFDNFRRLEGKPFATAFCTGNLRSATEHVFHGVVEKQKGAIRTAGKYFAVILAFIGGVTAGYFASRALGGYAALIAAGVLLLVLAAILCGHAVRMRRIRVRRLAQGEIPAAQALIWESFTRFVAPMFEAEGAENFRRFLYDLPLSDGYEWYGVFAGGMIKGALVARRDGTHIAAFFTKNGEQRRGYGGRLMRWYLANAGADTVTVNASPSGVPAYKKLGFSATDGEICKDGMRYVPMEYKKSVEKEK